MTEKSLPIIRLYGWSAKRSGARMTITGKKVTTGEDIKVSVDEIAQSETAVGATDYKTGQAYGLTVRRAV